MDVIIIFMRRAVKIYQGALLSSKHILEVTLNKQSKNFFQKIESGFVKYDLFLLEISPGDITSFKY